MGTLEKPVETVVTELDSKFGPFSETPSNWAEFSLGDEAFLGKMVRHWHPSSPHREYSLDVVGALGRLCGVGRGKAWLADTELSSLAHRAFLDSRPHPSAAGATLSLWPRALPLLFDSSVVAFGRRMPCIYGSVFIDMATPTA